MVKNAKEVWKAKATKLLLQYATENKYFMAEDAWHWAFSQGLELPESPNIRGAMWKAVMLKKGEAKVIPLGFMKAKSPKSHGHKFPIFLSRICPLEYESNCTFNESLSKLKTKLKFKEVTLDEYNDEFAYLLLKSVNAVEQFNIAP